jgi:hypothetical protein
MEIKNDRSRLTHKVHRTGMAFVTIHTSLKTIPDIIMVLLKPI